MTLQLFMNIFFNSSDFVQPRMLGGLPAKKGRVFAWISDIKFHLIRWKPLDVITLRHLLSH